MPPKQMRSRTAPANYQANAAETRRGPTFGDDLREVMRRQQEIYTRAVHEARDLSDEEDAEFTALTARAEVLRDAIRTQDARRKRLEPYERLIGARPVLPTSSQWSPDGTHSNPADWGLPGVNPNVGEWAGGAAQRWALALQDRAHATGLREFTGGGAVTVPALITDQIQDLDRVPTRVLELLGRQPFDSGARFFQYMVQTTRQNNAGPVAIGEVKPTSHFDIDLKQGNVETIAHVSDAIPKQYLTLPGNLDRFLQSELLYGLDLALQEQVLTGDGASPNLTGIIPQAGAVVDGGDFISLVRMTIATLEDVGVVPTAIVMNNHDAAAVDLMKDAVERFYGAGPFGSGPGTLWAIPRLATPAMEQGTALLGDFRAAELVTRGTAELSWSDSHADDYIKNLVRFRAEMEAAVAVLKPYAFRVISTAQIGPTAPETPAPQAAAATRAHKS